ncbi:MAG: hypothetical protein VW405_17220 [Rhodospirillaceae bacterium]
MNESIQDGKYVELTYRVVDQKSDEVLVAVEYPISYVHGANDILTPAVTGQLTGRAAGDVIEVPIDCNQLFGPRDEGLVFTDAIENVPEEYREVGTSIVTENADGETRSFLVTRVDEKSLTVDGNHPLCGRHVVFKLEVLGVRDATEDEIEAGGMPGQGPKIGTARMIPIQ